MTIYDYPFAGNNYEKEKLNLALTLLVDSDNKTKKFIHSTYILNVFRCKVTALYNILYKYEFIKNVKTSTRSNSRYFRYDVELTNKYMLLNRVDISEKLYKVHFNNKHFLNPNQQTIIPFQKVINYDINITDEQIEKEIIKNSAVLLPEERKIKKIKAMIMKHNEEKKWSVDNYSKRVHHLLTYSPAFLREYTTLGKIVEIDLHQCQPTLLAILLEDTIGPNEYSELFHKKYFDIYEFLSKDDRSLGKDMFMSMFFGVSNDKALQEYFGDDISDLIKNITTGNPEILGISKSDVRLLKSDLKKDCTEQEKILDKQLRKLFPTYKAMSLAAQLLEVELFDKIWKDLIKNKIEFFPVHDAIYCKPSDVREVKKIMKKHINQFTMNTKIKLNF